MPSAAFIGFLATFLALGTNYFLAAIKPSLIDLPLVQFDYMLMSVVFLMAIRHQIRIIFMDDVYILNKKAKLDWKNQFRLLFVLALLGGVSLSIFGYGSNSVSTFMFLYCILFVIFGFSLANKVSIANGMSGLMEALHHNKRISRDMLNILLSALVDVLCLIVWSAIFYYVIINGKNLNTVDGFSFFLLIILVIFISEYVMCFSQPVRKRLKHVLVLLF